MNTSTNFTKVCGIDVSKDDLDYCLIDNQTAAIQNISQITNEMDSIYTQFSSPTFDNTLFVLEYTGNYSSKLLHQLTALGRPVSVLNPLQSKNFMSLLGQTNKNDKQAAHSLSLAGRAVKLRRYQAPSKEMQERKQILSTLRALEKQARALNNQIHALEQLPFIDAQALDALQSVLKAVQNQITPLKTRLYDTAKDPDFNKKKRYATSVIGIGNKTAEAILLVTDGLKGFDKASKVAKFIGITPYSQQSGSSVRRKGRITKHGSSDARRLLYMCTVSAIQYNNACKALYERMRKNGKPHKVAVVAVMHKLVKQLFACVKNETMFDNEFHLKSDKISK